MDTLEFFRAILPADARYYAVHMSGGPTYHTMYPTLEALASAVLARDADGKSAVYHACASYLQGEVKIPDPKKPGELKRAWRVESNLGRMKAFWIDVDCGADKAAAVPPKGYATKNDAKNAVMAFCDEVGLPYPLIVSSGGGLHCYWPLTKDIAPAAWKAVAEVFKAVLKQSGVLQDLTRTADVASILRPPGTTNRKDPANPRAVKVVFPGGGAIDPKDFAAALQSARQVSKSVGFGELLVPSYVKAAPASSAALAGHAAYDGPKSSAEVVAQHCQQVRFVRDTQGDGTYDLWRGVIGIIKHCVEGEELAERWTENREATGHESFDWKTRYDTWNAGPATCQFFRDANPAGCDGCPHREKDGTPKYTSPITLGHMLPEPETEPTQVEVEVGGVKEVIEIPPKPEGYEWSAGKMLRYITDADGIVHAMDFSDTHFYLTHWSQDEAKDAWIGVRAFMPRGGYVDFEMKAEVTGSDTDARKALAAKSVNTTHGGKAPMHLNAYLKDSLAKLKADVDQMNTMTTFGWKNDDTTFLIGERLYRPDGTYTRVLLNGPARDKARNYQAPIGTLADYSDAVNEVYARAGMEPLQYAFCSGYGSILAPFATEENYRGLLFAVTGAATAKGKTTVAHASLYGFGDARENTHAKNGTENSRYKLMGAHNNLAILFDEFTDIGPKELSEWAYSTSEGREKDRLGSGANRQGFSEVVQWSMSPFVTANTDLYARLAQHRNNTHAESARILQISIDNYDIPQLGNTQVSAALQRMRRNRGNAGHRFIEYVVNHRHAVERLAAELAAKLAAEIEDVKYRLWRAHATCTLTAAKILIDLGVVAFDFDRLYAFTLDLLKGTVHSVETRNATDPESAIHDMIHALSPRIFDTPGFVDTRHGGVKTLVNVSSAHEIAGRSIGTAKGTPKKFANKLLIVSKAFETWCADNGLNSHATRVAAHRLGLLDAVEPEKIHITMGTNQTTYRPVCLIFDQEALAGPAMLKLVQDDEEAAA